MGFLKAILSIIICIPCFAQNSNPTPAGIGLVAINNTYNASLGIVIYKDKNLKTVLYDAKLYDLQYLHPYSYKPDYGIVHFVCLEKTPTYYKVLFNETKEGYLKNYEGNSFKLWESLFLEGSVERLDPEKNQIFQQPDENAQIINSARIFFQVDEVLEINGKNWIHVQFSKSGADYCGDQPPGDCLEGWFLWKKDNKLLIAFLLAG